MQDELTALAELLREATCPEDVFGKQLGTKVEVDKLVRKEFHRLAKICHPDNYVTNPGLRKIAEETFKDLAPLFEQAEAKLTAGTYGNNTIPPPQPKVAKGPVVLTTRQYVYVLKKQVHTGGTCAIHRGTAQNKKGELTPVVIKVPFDYKDNDLLDREARALKLMKEKAKQISIDPKGTEYAKKLLLRVPDVLEVFKIREPGAQNDKVGIAYAIDPHFETGWFTLEEIRARYPTGVNTRIMVFVFNRILEALTLAHAAGVVHGALTPNHVLIHAETHAGQVIDWTASCVTAKGETVPYVDQKYQGYFPPEILTENVTPTAPSDIYMAAWCMVYLLGGNPKDKIIPGTVEEPLRDILNKCLQPTRRNRFLQVTNLYAQLAQTTFTLWGKKKFVPLVMQGA